MQEILACLDSFESHKERYKEVEQQLIHLYRDHANGRAIVSLLEYWLFSMGGLHQSYGDKGLAGFLLSKNNDPISYAHSYEFDVAQLNLHSTSGRRVVAWVDRYLSVQYRLPSAPSSTFTSKLLAKYTKLLAFQLTCNYDQDLASGVLKIIHSYLLSLGVEIGGYLVVENIPNIFKSRPIQCRNPKKTSFHCAPIELMQFKGYENMLLLDREMELCGYQHGGGYDVAYNDPLTYFEKKISDKFTGWGFSEYNMRQARYTLSQSAKGVTSKNSKVIWIESSKDPKFTSYCYPVLFYVKNQKETLMYIHQELVDGGVKYFSKKYPGALESNCYQGMRGCDVGSDQRADKILIRGDIVIFDNCMHSLIYYCLENNILFLIVDREDVMQYYTHKMLLWHRILRKNDLLFYSSERGLLKKRIKECNSVEGLPKEVHRYYRSVFN